MDTLGSFDVQSAAMYDTSRSPPPSPECIISTGYLALHATLGAHSLLESACRLYPQGSQLRETSVSSMYSMFTSSPPSNSTLHNHYFPQPLERWTELSFSQAIFWFVLKFLNGMAGLNHTGLFRMTGSLRVADLKRAVVQLGKRHEVLRTCFKAFDNRPQQGIMESSRLSLEHRHISSEEEVMPVFKELQSSKS